jgi:hypothetical protein
MGSKIQGEGDYESAKRFNKMEQDFVKRKYGKQQIDQAIDDDTLDSDDDTEIAENDEIRRLRMNTPPTQRR